MKIAFHFDADHERFDRYDGMPVIKEIFRQLLQRQETTGLHLKVFSGDIAALDYVRDRKNREELWRGFFMPPRPVWQSLRPDFMDFLYNRKIFVAAFEGMGSRLRDSMHEVLLNDETYLGAQQVHEANPVHWVLYGASVLPLCRITGKALHLFYSIGSDDLKDQAVASYLTEALPFESVTFEEMAVSHTILDSYSSYEHASRVVNLSTALYDHLNLVADQVLLRLTDLAPELYDQLHNTLMAFGDLENPGGPAKAAGACRDMLDSLAVSTNLPGAQLRDIMDRIKSLEGCGEGLENPDPLLEGGRLILELLVFICDLIMPAASKTE